MTTFDNPPVPKTTTIDDPYVHNDEFWSPLPPYHKDISIIKKKGIYGVFQGIQ